MPGGDGTGPTGQGPGTGRGMRGKGMGQGGGRGGRGHGRMGGNMQGAGTGGNCVCPGCGATVSHSVSVPCNQAQCPKCGTAMVRQ